MNKILAFFLIGGFSVSLMGMERYRRTRDEILASAHPNPEQLRNCSEQDKDFLFKDYHKALHNAVAQMRKDEEKEPLAMRDLLLGALVSCFAWNLYSKSSDPGLAEYCLCAGSAAVCCLTVFYGAIDICHRCHKRRHAQQLKIVEDVMGERATLLHQD
jgi:hypothetical protein